MGKVTRLASLPLQGLQLNAFSDVKSSIHSSKQSTQLLTSRPSTCGPDAAWRPSDLMGHGSGWTARFSSTNLCVFFLLHLSRLFCRLWSVRICLRGLHRVALGDDDHDM